MKQRAVLIFILLVMSFISSHAQLELATIFTDHMVMQRDVSVPIWGWSSASTPVTVHFKDKTYTTQVQAQGKWKVLLPATAVGGPYEIKISQGNESKHLKDIVFGDVWLCSGQSNMEWTLQNSMRAEEEIENAKDHLIRHFKVTREGADFPEERLNGGPWEVTSSETVGDFTAVGYFFAKELRAKTGVPIGLLNSSWGGSRVEPWMSAEALGYADSKSAGELSAKKRQAEAATQRKNLETLLGTLPEKDEGLVDGVGKWAAMDYNTTDWKKMELPILWEEAGLSNLDGIVWFRKTIQLSAAEAKAGIVLHLGKIDDSDMTWVNGAKVGTTEQKYNVNRIYEVPAAILKTGTNVITVRVEDTGGGGGIYGDDNGEIGYQVGDEMRSLSGEWTYKVGQVKLQQLAGGQTNQMPMLLYNKMIHPILDFPIKGVIWYQGESNARESDDYEYRTLFADMIVDWRERWKSGEFPFLFVQLANFMPPSPQPTESSWATLRESQSSTLQVPNTAQAVIIDLGEAGDIHPRNKHDVGYRLALSARKLAYGEKNLVASGPTYKKMKQKGEKIVLYFDNIGDGLIAKNGKLQEFAIAGADKKFVWADAKIKGKKIIVQSDKVKNPVAVRYAWANNPDKANLYNKEGLPASPFRTDEW